VPGAAAIVTTALLAAATACSGGGGLAPLERTDTAPAAPAERDGYYAAGPKDQQLDPANHSYFATVATADGDIEFELWPALAPQNVNAFVFLARAGFYDGLPFHRVIADFVVQGGDPLGTGLGGPGFGLPGDGQPVQNLTGLYTVIGWVTDGLEAARAVAQGDVMRSVTVTAKGVGASEVSADGVRGDVR
jgi:cyclophilin family peptidyl-prolyl cis-trans isomerase